MFGCCKNLCMKFWIVEYFNENLNAAPCKLGSNCMVFLFYFFNNTYFTFSKEKQKRKFVCLLPVFWRRNMMGGCAPRLSSCLLKFGEQITVLTLFIGDRTRCLACNSMTNGDIGGCVCVGGSVESILKLQSNQKMWKSMFVVDRHF